MQSPAAIEITLRFKEAFEHIHATKGHGRKAHFCRSNGINPNQLNTLFRTPQNRMLPPYWIACLCRDYGISVEWILFGVGEIAKIKNCKIPANK
jgi:hypothetical protein